MKHLVLFGILMMLLPLSCASQNTKDKLVITFSDYDTAHLEELQELWREYPPIFLDAAREEMQYSKIEMDKREKERTVLYVSFDKPLTFIGPYSDYYYGNVVVLPETVTSVTIPDSVIGIGPSAFACCSSLTSINIPDSVISIGPSAFAYCSSLTSINIPDSVTFIGAGAFTCCSSLTSINIPGSVTFIGEYAFSGCTSLDVTVTNSNLYMFKDFSYYDGAPVSVIIPETVTTIEDATDATFKGCSFLTSVIIPDSVISIGPSAFAYCSSLTSINIPDSVTSIGENAFRDCSSLTSINIPDSVTSIGEDAFRGCTSLTSINIPNSVTSIGYGAFRRCNTLRHVTLPDKSPFLEIMDSGIFENGVPLKNIQWKCLRIEDNGCVFFIAHDGTLVTAGFTNETATTMAGTIIPSPEEFEWLESHKEYKEDHDWVHPEKKFDPFVTVKEVVIPNGVKKIGEASFSLLGMTSVIVPDSVNSIGKDAFFGCELLTSVSLPQSLVNIGENAFPETTKIIRR